MAHGRGLNHRGTVFFALVRPYRSLLDNVLNEIDDMPNTPLALSSMISQLGLHIESVDKGFVALKGFVTLSQIFSRSVSKLKAEMSRLNPTAANGSSSLTLDVRSPLLTMMDVNINELQKVGSTDNLNRFSTDEFEGGYHLFGKKPCVEESQSVASGSTVDSSISSCSYTSFGRRGGCRRPVGKLTIPSLKPKTRSEGGLYQCTFRPSRFHRKYMLHRHEETVHVPFATAKLRFEEVSLPTRTQCVLVMPA